MPKKPRKSPSKAQDSAETIENPEPLQSKPQIVNPNGSTGLAVPDAKATAIAACLAQGFSVNRICKELGTSHHTVTAIARNRPELVDQQREITRRNWQAVAMLATGELIDRVPNMKDQGLAVAAAIATEKMELLGGNATSRIEHSHKPSADEWQEMLASIPEADARVVEAVETGNPSQPPPAKGCQDQAATLLPPQSGDVESSAFGSADRVNPALVSTLVPTVEHLQPSPHALDGGEEGVAASLSSIDPHSSHDQKFFTKTLPANQLPTTNKTY